MKVHTERAVRVALARLFAIRHDRPVPLDEIARAADLSPAEALVHLRALQAQRLATASPEGGWRPAALPLASRAREPMAAFSWIHA